MRLTTRLMQLAWWLLLHRAVNEGEMSLAQANKEKTKVKLAAGDPVDEETLKALPARPLALIARARKLHDAVRRLDATIHAPIPEEVVSNQSARSPDPGCCAPRSSATRAISANPGEVGTEFSR